MTEATCLHETGGFGCCGSWRLQVGHIYCQAASSLRGNSSSLERPRVCHLMNANIEFARDKTVDGDFTPITALTMSNISPGDEVICLPTMLCSNDDLRKKDHFVTAAFISASLISWKDCSLERPSENWNAECRDVEPKQYRSRTWWKAACQRL